MNERVLLRMCAGVLCYGLLAATGRAQHASRLLPLKRVRLYEVGIGYFERSGRLGDKTDLGLSLPSSQLDDALSSLVIVGGAGKARIASIEFEARESTQLARADAALSNDPSAPLEFASVLRSFRGVAVEVRQHGARVRGRLVDVISLQQANAESCVAPNEPRAPASAAPGQSAGCTETLDANLVVLSADGTLTRLLLSRVESVRALDAAVAARLSRALDAVSQRSSTSGRKILHIRGSGSATLTLGYVAETPVWRASYRLLLDDHARTAKIQGFALVHNDTDEAWRGVKLELVNGQPSSFLYPLAAPRYARRALITPAESLSTVPQLLSQSADDLWHDEESDTGGSGISFQGSAEGGRGEGLGLGSTSTPSQGDGSLSAGDPLQASTLTDLASATGSEGAAQFLYVLGPAVDLGAHASALVPFVDESVELRRVTWFGDSDNDGETAVRLLNSSTQTLPMGVLSVFSEAGFSGSSLLPRTKPGETRVLRFGRDLDVTLERSVSGIKHEPRSYSFENGRLREHSLRGSKVTCALANKSVADRYVSVALEVVPNARIEGADQTAYDSALGRALASFELPARSSARRELQITEGIVTLIPEAQATSEFLKRAATFGSIPKAQRLILARAGDALSLAEIRRAALPKRKAEIEEALSDASRLESHVRALGSSSNEGQWAAERLRQTEDRLSRLREQAGALEGEALEYEGRSRRALEELGRAAPPEVELGPSATANDAG